MVLRRKYLRVEAQKLTNTAVRSRGTVSSMPRWCRRLTGRSVLYHDYLRGRRLLRWLLIGRLIPKITVFNPVRSAIREPDGSVSTVMMAARTQREKAIR